MFVHRSVASRCHSCVLLLPVGSRFASMMMSRAVPSADKRSPRTSSLWWLGMKESVKRKSGCQQVSPVRGTNFPTPPSSPQRVLRGRTKQATHQALRRWVPNGTQLANGSSVTRIRPDNRGLVTGVCHGCKLRLELLASVVAPPYPIHVLPVSYPSHIGD